MPHHHETCTWMTGAGCSCGAWTQADAGAVQDELQRLRDIEARYHWLCAHLTQIHVETTQPAGSPADTPMRVTLMQAWPNLPRTDAASVDAAVVEAMKEMS